MKKTLSILLAILGIASVLFVCTTIANYGATNMRRVEAQSIQYKMSWASRR